MEKFFAFFGKFILVALLLGGIAYGAYSFGKRGLPTAPSNSGAITVPATATPIQIQVPLTDTSTSPTPTKKVYKTVTAGLTTSGDGPSFGKYQITILDGWAYEDNTDATNTMDTLTITKDTYQIKIYQAATGGAVCVYAGDAAFEGPSATYDTFVDITTTGGFHLRRSGNTGSATFTLCDKGPELYGAPTRFGHITYKTPTAPDLISLTEMDLMVASLKKL